MKFIWFLVGFALCGTSNASIEAFGGPVIDTRAPAYFAHLIDRSNYVVIPTYDSTRKTVSQPIVIRDRAQLDELGNIFQHTVYQPTSHILAMLAGGPITFYATEKSRVLTLEQFGDVVRLNDKDYRIDKRSAAAINEWFKRAGDNKAPDRTAPSVTPPARESRH